MCDQEKDETLKLIEKAMNDMLDAVVAVYRLVKEYKIDEDEFNEMFDKKISETLDKEREPDNELTK